MRCIISSRAEISIHAPREGGDEVLAVDNCECQISIHAPREGGDDYRAAVNKWLSISIHAPREGGDYAGSRECRKS